VTRHGVSLRDSHPQYRQMNNAKSERRLQYR
jgi:hypothetical protein